METIQVAISDEAYRAALRELLVRNGAWEVVCVNTPDSQALGVMVLDSDCLDMLPRPIPNPERVVLVARDERDDQTRAWEAGVTSVVTAKDPLNTVVLAVMAARLRTGKSFQSGSIKDPPGAKPPGVEAASEGVEEERARAAGGGGPAR